jgi:hypothetical protein
MRDRPRHFHEPVGKRGLSVVNVRDNCEIADMGLYHGSIVPWLDLIYTLLHYGVNVSLAIRTTSNYCSFPSLGNPQGEHMSIVSDVQSQILQITGVIRPAKSRMLIIEVSQDNFEPIARLLHLPDGAYIGVPQFIGALIANNIRTEKRRVRNTVIHLVYLEYYDIARLLSS